jgi:hypothetical protein
MGRTKDQDLLRHESPFRVPPSPKATLKDAQEILKSRIIERRPYQRTRRQADDAKRVSDRIMGERNEG